MANHNNPIPEYITAEYMADNLKLPLNATSILVNSMDFTPGSAVGDNYCCQIWRIFLDLTVDEKPRKLSVIAKVTPLTRTLDSISELFDVFEIEASLFGSTLPTIQNNLAIKPDFNPECYFIDYKNKVIYMEDLKASDYVLQPRGKFLGKEHCVLVLKALAQFHAGSYFAIQADPSLIEKYKASFWDGELRDMPMKFYEVTQKSLEKLEGTFGLSAEDQKKLLQFKDRTFGDDLKVLKKRDDNFNVLLHGDCWMNNMLFHYNNDRVDKIKLLDYQITYHGCFANDLLYFLFSSGDADVVTQQLDDLLEIYYLKLKEVGPAIPDITLDRIKKEFNERLFFGYIMAISFRAFILSETPPDMDSVLDGVQSDMGFDSPQFISDLHKFLPFFKQHGIF